MGEQQTTPSAAPLSQQAAGQASQEFLAGFAEEDRNYLTEKGYQSTADLLKAAREADKFAGVNLDSMVSLPAENATQEELDAFYNKLGRPQDASHYKLPVLEGDNDALAKAIAPVLFSAGLSQGQASKLAEGWNEYVKQARAAQQEAYAKEQAQQMNDLQKEWGAEYQKNEEVARQAARKYGLNSGELDAMERALGSGKLMKLMFAIGSTTMDAELKGASGPASQAVYTPQEAKAKLDALVKDKEFGKKFMAKDPAAVKLLDDLTKAAVGV